MVIDWEQKATQPDSQGICFPTEQQYPPQTRMRQVHFLLDEIQIHETMALSELTALEKQSAFYNWMEMTSMKKAATREAKAYETRKDNDNHNNSSTFLEYNMTGLEHCTQYGKRRYRWNQDIAKRTVLKKQEEARSLGIALGAGQDEEISKAYRRASMDSMRQAQLRGQLLAHDNSMEYQRARSKRASFESKRREDFPASKIWIWLRSRRRR